MATLLQRGFSLLNRATEAAAAETVRYIRGAEVISDELPATLSAPQIEQLDEGGTVIGRQFVWRLKQSDLLVENVMVRPEAYDLIEWIHNDLTYTFEVMPDLGGASSNAVDPRSDWVPASAKLIERQ